MAAARNGLSNVKRTKAIEIMEDLRDAINEGRYYPNETLTEAQIAAEYGVSITPAREALAMLSTKGYIQKTPHRGYLIRAITLDEVQMLYEMRSILESGIVSLLVQRARVVDVRPLIEEADKLLMQNEEDIRSQFRRYNHRFHMDLADLANNGFLMDSYSSVMNKLWRAMAVGLAVQDVKESLRTHIKMCEAILAQDEELAKELFIGSMSNSRVRAVSGLREVFR